MATDFTGQQDRGADRSIGNVLGWVSLGLGVAALLAPRAVGRATGLGDRSTLLRFVGARELASGIGLLSTKNQTPWLWSRVAGDMMDLALLGTALRPGNLGRSRAISTIGAVAAITGMDVGESVRQSIRARSPSRASEAFVEQSVTVSKSPQECYEFWRNEGNRPKFSRMLESVTLVDDRPGERITWHSLEDSPVLHAGTVRFDRASGDRGTVIRVLLHYRPPLGRTSTGVAKLLGHDPSSEVREDLRRYKALLETGEIPSTRGQPSGRRSFLGRLTPEGRKSRQEQRDVEETSVDRHASMNHQGARA